MLHLVRCHPYACICYGDLHCLPAAVRLHGKGHAASRRRELDGIVQKDNQQLSQTILVGIQDDRDGGGQRHSNILIRRQGTNGSYSLFGHGPQIDVFLTYFQCS